MPLLIVDDISGKYLLIVFLSVSSMPFNISSLTTIEDSISLLYLIVKFGIYIFSEVSLSSLSITSLYISASLSASNDVVENFKLRSIISLLLFFI